MSALAHLYFAAEDYILQSWASLLKPMNLAHLSLHYDGVRVWLPDGQSSASLIALSQEHIKGQTGFAVSIREKCHFTVLESLQQRARGSFTERHTEPVLKQDGNCIPSVLAYLKDNETEIAQLLQAASSENTWHHARGSRPYRQCVEYFHASLSPTLGLQDLTPGKYLLHSECRGRPHCVGFSFASKAPLSKKHNYFAKCCGACTRLAL